MVDIVMSCMKDAKKSPETPPRNQGATTPEEKQSEYPSS